MVVVVKARPSFFALHISIYAITNKEVIKMDKDKKDAKEQPQVNLQAKEAKPTCGCGCMPISGHGHTPPAKKE